MGVYCGLVLQITRNGNTNLERDDPKDNRDLYERVWEDSRTDHLGNPEAQYICVLV